MKKHQIKILKKYRGFTLVELIIVITILAILSTIAFVSFSGYVKNSRDTKRLSDINQIKKGVEIYKESYSKPPIPDEAIAYTGAKNTLYVGKINNKVLPTLSNGVLDPLNNEEYLYATFDNGNYFQIGGFSENEIGYNFISKTYADYKSSIVEGNYLFDPALPSLLISSGTTLYDKNNCFIVNGGGSSCVNKTELLGKNYDKGLVGYWDMESLTVDNKLKDLSGNGFDGTFKGSGFLNINSTIENGLFGKAIRFQPSGENQENLTKIEYPGLVYKNYDNFTVSTLVKPDLNGINNWFSMIIGGGFGNNLILGIAINSKGDLFLHDYSSNKDISYNYNKGILKTGEFYNITFNYSNHKLKLFLNGNKLGETNFTYGVHNSTLTVLGAPFNDTYNRGFKGLIDEVKIYNRALSDDEILQQSKILGL